MKKLIALSLVSIIVLLAFCGCTSPQVNEVKDINPLSNLYPLTAICVRTNHSDGVAYLEDYNGILWGIVDEDSEWEVGDVGSMIMNDNGTDNIDDDIIELL